MPNNDAVTFTRDCEAVLIPAGDLVEIPEGTHGNITQALGGSFTVYIAGNLIRVAGEDADAIGQEQPEPLTLPPDAHDEDIEALAVEQLRTVFDPEIPINVLDLGLIYECQFDHSNPDARTIYVEMTLTAPGCGMGDIIADDLRNSLLIIPTVERVDVEIVLDPPWSMEMMSDAAKLQVGMI
ncbi:MAG TPA: putative Fe-S cluster assembly protein SufT [Salinisphaeraceae bacterium]|nr:putative Fe-S cluster assembly protein SufT [Salinisphaeraceae bacterium]